MMQRILDLTLSTNPDGSFVVEVVDRPGIGGDHLIEGLHRLMPGGSPVLENAAALNIYRLRVETDNQLGHLLEALATLNSELSAPGAASLKDSL